MLKSILIPIHPAGFPFIGIFVCLTIIFWFISDILVIVGIVLTLWCIYFFRNPKRVTPTREGLIISPADGVVQMISKSKPPEELNMGETPVYRIAIFMNVFDVHINRCPVSGVISEKYYKPGKFFNASLDKASELNERMSIKATMQDGSNVAFVQIAGLIARRIVCFVEEGDELKAGERFGLIRFGSRVDVYLPPNIEPHVCIGQLSIGGETILADCNSGETGRFGRIN